MCAIGAGMALILRPANRIVSLPRYDTVLVRPPEDCAVWFFLIGTAVHCSICQQTNMTAFGVI